MGIKRFFPPYPAGVWYLAGVNFLTRFITFMMLPLSIIYLGKIGYQESEVGWILGIGWIIGAFGGPLVGYLVDKLGSKRVYAVILILWSVSFVGYGFTQSFWILMFLAILNGFCRSTVEVVILSRMFASVSTDQQSNINRFQYIILNWGAIMGTVAGAYTGKYVEQNWFTYMGLVFLVLIVVDRFIPQGKQEKDEKTEQTQSNPSLAEVMRIISKDRVLLLLLFSGICYMIGYIQLDSTIPIALNEQNQMHTYALLNVENSLLVIVLAVPIMNWASKWRPSVVVFIMCLFVSLSLLCFAFTYEPLYYVGVLFYTIGEIAFFPLWRQKVADLGGSMKGTYLGLTNFSYLGFFFGSFLGGTFFEQGGSLLVFSIMAIIVQLTFLFYIFAVMLQNKNEKEIIPRQEA
ncbi:MFS transporter [Shimazuella sp. AN120528]|uniref:MFS transporter n=1 Tax=Shimazuella soli TaxID=1892854 RepID=UPI001F0FDAD7|nr:MFS transporter [Shimazuella soli]MCH5584942.1 MFS transporter [Shimazuella soli]